MLKMEKRDEIVRAALEIIAEHGFHGAPIAMIASRAGVGAGTIYRYFENKEILISALYREIEDRLYPFILQGYEPARPIRERFLQLGAALLRYFLENPLDFRYVEQFHNSPYGAALRRARLLGENADRDVFRELFEEGISQQVMKDLPVTVLCALAFGPVFVVARDHILDFTRMDDVLIAKTIEACWDGIRR
ncbi:TetR/AcrR family transcriptional regulator [Thiovibrio sp. JS02]